MSTSGASGPGNWRAAVISVLSQYQMLGPYPRWQRLRVQQPAWQEASVIASSYADVIQFNSHQLVVAIQFINLALDGPAFLQHLASLADAWSSSNVQPIVDCD